MKKISLLTGLLLFVCSFSAQVNDVFAGKRFIEVTGTAETEVVPDEIFITITLREPNDNKEKNSIEKQEKELRDHIKSLGIDLSNLTLNSADADYGKIRAFKKDVTVSKSYILKVGNAEMVGKLYERLDKMNAHDAFVSRYSHTRILDLQKENRIKAIKASLEKVKYLLEAVSQQPGPPLQILETENYVQDGPQPVYRAYKNALQSYDSEAGGEDQAISFKKIKIRSGFIVKYEILNNE